MPRPRKGAHIYRRKGRRNWYAYVDRDHKNISLETEDEAEAQAGLAALLDRDGLRALSEGKRPLASIFSDYRERSRTNNTTKTAYENDLNLARVLLWLEERGITTANDVTIEAVEDYKTARRFAKRSAARINRELQSWRNAMRVAVEMREAHASILVAFKRMREPRPLPHRPGLTKAEIDRFLSCEPHPGYRAMFRTAVGTGLRDAELFHMERTDIRPPHVVVAPKDGWTTKGYRYRSIPVTRATLAAARAFVKAKADLNLDKKAVWKRIQAARKRARIKRRFSLQDLRRAFASHALAAGYRLEQIQQWLGHADLVTTQRYLRVVDGGKVDTSRLVF
jgi:site-specific recombinase XerD